MGYFYMREFWITIGTSPILYRYIDWSITVPLQMVEFYFILSAVNDKIGSGMFFRLFVGTVMMLAFGYAGESHFFDAWLAFALGMAGGHSSCMRYSLVRQAKKQATPVAMSRARTPS